ncbi:MAG: TauD/TfdA family dioxygenase [Pseudomonadota bacterium]|nr:TauD/TfdA family dioxygenase [Pseudomonadota bacterium]
MNITAVEGLGAEITDVDITSLTDAEFKQIEAAFAEHGVIFFRDQTTSENDHIAFAERFGEINVNRFFAAHPDYPQIALVAKEPDQKDNIGGGWHTDHSYDLEPALGSVLVARELPDSGGDTMFASMYKAYETLPADLKKKIEGRKALHSGKHIFGESEASYYNTSDAGSHDDGTSRIGNAAVAETLTDPEHPIVITHPLSGKKALYVNPAFTREVVGMDKTESDELLSELYTHVFKGHDFHHRFKWEPGSIAMWDNRSTWHWALNDYQGQRRIMHRITIEGCPLGA